MYDNYLFLFLIKLDSVNVGGAIMYRHYVCIYSLPAIG